jgi:hypothetical protein
MCLLQDIKKITKSHEVFIVYMDSKHCELKWYFDIYILLDKIDNGCFQEYLYLFQGVSLGIVELIEGKLVYVYFFA